MKKLALLLSCTLLLAASGPGKEAALRKRIESVGFFHEKVALGEKLGRMRTEAARTELLSLLEHDSYWEREAAVAGLFELEDGAVAGALIEKYLNDHMIRDRLEKGFVAHGARFVPELVKAARKEGDSDKKEKLLAIISQTRRPEAEAFLKDLVADKREPLRATAMTRLLEGFPKGNRAYALAVIEDRTLREPALVFLVKDDAREELPRFLDIIRRRDEARYVVIALEAVSRWADAKTKEEVAIQALCWTDDTVVQAGLNAFGGIRTDRLKAELARLVRSARFQYLRLQAAAQLGDYGTRDVVPSLVLALREQYQGGGPRDAVLTALSPLTLGLISVVDDLARRGDASAFEERQRQIGAKLARITGRDFGTSFEEWQEWAVLDGHTVDGQNLVQYLFSGYPARRRKALDASLKVLGLRNREALAREAGVAGQDELALALAAAKRLVEKGVVRDEP